MWFKHYTLLLIHFYQFIFFLFTFILLFSLYISNDVSYVVCRQWIYSYNARMIMSANISCCFFFCVRVCVCACAQLPFCRLRHFFTSHEKCIRYFLKSRIVACTYYRLFTNFMFCLECIENVYNVNSASVYYEECVQTYMGYHIPYHQWISYDLNTASGHGDRSNLIDPRNNVTLCRRTVRANRTATDVGYLVK